jgi:hypothetical protein
VDDLAFELGDVDHKGLLCGGRGRKRKEGEGRGRKKRDGKAAKMG